MPTEQTTSPALERLAPEEIVSLRRRFAEGGVSDLRADGAATLDDVAEAFGVAPAEVRRQLDRIRQERAVAPAVRPKRDQRGLLAFATVLLGSAYAIHVLNPRSLSTDEQEANMERTLAEQRARHKDRPRTVHYPIETTVKTGALPPPGFSIEFRGPLTTTKVVAESGGTLSERAAEATLEEALINGVRAAREAERNAPPPTKPLPKNPFTGWEPTPESLVYSIGGAGFGTTGQIQMVPRGKGTVEADDRFFAHQAAVGAVQSTIERQEASLKPSPPGTGMVMPPAGYSVEFDGWQKSTVGGASNLPFFHMDEARVARKLEWTIRSLAWKDSEPPTLSTPGNRAQQAKRPVPAFADVIVTGPLGPVHIRLPMTASKGYPTAADAARASDRVLSAGVREAAAQIGRLERGERTG